MHIIHSHQVLTLPISLHSSSFSSSSLHIMRVKRFMGRNPLRKNSRSRMSQKVRYNTFSSIVETSTLNYWSCGSNQIFIALFHQHLLLIFVLFNKFQCTKELASSSSSGSSHSSSSTASRALQCVDLSECNEYFARWI